MAPTFGLELANAFGVIQANAFGVIQANALGVIQANALGVISTDALPKMQQLQEHALICYSAVRMKTFSRMTNSVVMTAVLLAVIIGSLCFSVGEGMRLTPFPNPSLAPVHDSSELIDAGTIDELSIAKYGPLDVPAQTQKRGKRQALDLASESVTGTRPVVTAAVYSFVYEADKPHCLSFITPHSGRAPPFQS